MATTASYWISKKTRRLVAYLNEYLSTGILPDSPRSCSIPFNLAVVTAVLWSYGDKNRASLLSQTGSSNDAEKTYVNVVHNKNENYHWQETHVELADEVSFLHLASL